MRKLQVFMLTVLLITLVFTFNSSAEIGVELRCNMKEPTDLEEKTPDKIISDLEMNFYGWLNYMSD